MLKKLLQRISFTRTSWDPVEYWSKRASDAETMSVMWQNLAFNDLVDRDEWSLIGGRLPERRGSVLDLGCGTGRMSERLAAEFHEYTGVDVDAMVAEARRRLPGLADRFVGATVDRYEFPAERFDLVLSLGCLATACSKDKLAAVAPKLARSVRRGGRLLLIEPFHRSWLLTRGCKTTTRQVAVLFEESGMTVDELDGILFPPLRMVLSEKVLEPFPQLTKLGYRAGEAIVRLSPVALADYKLLSFSKR